MITAVIMTIAMITVMIVMTAMTIVMIMITAMIILTMITITAGSDDSDYSGSDDSGSGYDGI